MENSLKAFNILFYQNLALLKIDQQGYIFYSPAKQLILIYIFLYPKDLVIVCKCVVHAHILMLPCFDSTISAPYNNRHFISTPIFIFILVRITLQLDNYTIVHFSFFWSCLYLSSNKIFCKQVFQILQL